MKDRVYIIAEAGSNHNGDVEIALRMIDAAKEAGADAVKFQTFTSDELTTVSFHDLLLLNENLTEEHSYESAKMHELTYDDHVKLSAYAAELGIDFMSSPFDIPSIDLLNGLGVETYKIPSGEIVNLPYLRRLASLRKKYIISTGMCRISEIDDVLDVFLGAGCRREDIILLHANTEYPTPYEDVNLLAMVNFGKNFKMRYGYSDHTIGTEVAVAAVAMGASVIEKHFTLSRNSAGPDQAVSLEPHELKKMVDAIRHIEMALGDGVKRPSESEIKNIAVARKSLVAKKDIKKGDIFTVENLTAKRPGTGISPMKWDSYIGKKSDRNYSKDELIKG